MDEFSGENMNEVFYPCRKFSRRHDFDVFSMSSYMSVSYTHLYLLTTAMKKENEDKKICILTATSGDTGKAALEGFADVPGTEIIVFFPNQGVSEVQERQMITQEGANTHVFAIEGNFDDAQTGVKKIFNDADFAKKLAEHGCKLSSANSINIGRLIPQVAYYVYGYAKLVERGVISDCLLYTSSWGRYPISRKRSARCCSWESRWTTRYSCGTAMKNRGTSWEETRRKRCLML